MVCEMMEISRILLLSSFQIVFIFQFSMSQGNVNTLCYLCVIAAADPGFPAGGGAPTRLEGMLTSDAGAFRWKPGK